MTTLYDEYCVVNMQIKSALPSSSATDLQIFFLSPHISTLSAYASTGKILT